ncbi:MAG TPA: MucB/RseB C-terminal domain-containing protein [Burkholderiales bacterium]|nr:MucB/RseB C-terminal domain-containing protein [Burkholderiales bacterium]
MVARALGLACALLAGAAHAQAQDALEWLRRIQEATHRLSYSGTFVYQHGARSETSRITRYADPAGDIEKVEVMDGVPRELVRTRDTVKCYLPDSKVVKVERRTGERDFPALLPDAVALLQQHYDLSLGESRRIAGLECRAVVLTPKDNLRYGYRLYADRQTGMLMKAVTFDSAGHDVEQVTFTQLSLGHVTREMVKPRHPATRDWRVEDAAAVPANLQGWAVASDLPGFRKIVELKRRLGDSRPVGQLVYSDGLAAVSVFIEPMEGQADAVRPALASMGATHIYTREVAHHRVTVVGEAPAASVRRIADSVQYQPNKP